MLRYIGDGTTCVIRLSLVRISPWFRLRFSTFRNEGVRGWLLWLTFCWALGSYPGIDGVRKTCCKTRFFASFSLSCAKSSKNLQQAFNSKFLVLSDRDLNLEAICTLIISTSALCIISKCDGCLVLSVWLCGTMHPSSVTLTVPEVVGTENWGHL